MNWEKSLSATSTYIQNYPIFHLFHELRKMEKSSQNSIKKSLDLFVNWKNLELQPKTNTQSIPTLDLWTNWKNSYSNLNFTVENKRLFA